MSETVCTMVWSTFGHPGRARVSAQRARVLAEAFAQHPERFPNGRPSPRPLPTAVWINPPKARIDGEEAESTVAPVSQGR